MNSVGKARRTPGDVSRGGTPVRMLMAMLLVALALPIGTIGSAYGEEPAAADESLSQAAAEEQAPAAEATGEEAPQAGTGESQPVDAGEGADTGSGATGDGGTSDTEPTGDAATDATTGAATEPATEPATESGAGAPATRQAALAAPAGPEPLELVAPVAQTGGFEIDGDTAANNGGLDWDTTGTTIVDGAGDGSVYTTGNEVTDPREWTDTSSSSSPGNDDIVTAYSHAAMVDGQLWVFFGFERATTSGTSNYVIEYNRLGNWSDNPAQPRRSPGDLRVRVTQGGSGAFFVAGVERWSLTSGPGCVAVTAKDKSVVGHWCPAPDATPWFKGVSSDDKDFAEGALNLSGLLGGADNCLGGYGVVNMRSFSGGSESSQLKDYVAGTPVSVPSTCGSLDILKVDQFGDPVPGATFTVSPNPAPGGGSGTLTVTDGGAGDPDGTADGTISIDPARPGSYAVTETGVPAGHLPPDVATQQAVVPVNGSDSVTFVNARTFEPLTATTTGWGTFDVRHDWQVGKAVDRTSAEVAAGTPAVVTYTVTLEAVSAERFGHEAGGTLSVTNPNDAPVLATVTADITGGTCTFDGTDASGAAGHQVTVPPGTHGFPYTCDVTGAPTSGDVDVTVAWDEAVYPPVPGTDPGNPATADGSFDYTVDEQVDEQVVVTDSFAGGTAEELGTFGWDDVWGHTVPADEAPGGVALADTVVVATYARSIDGVAGECTDYANVATATESDSGRTTTAGRSVEVCVGLDLDVDKTVGVSYTRTYGWDLAKSGPATVFVGDDGQGSATYDISVTATQPMDTGVTVAGTITVTNPNDWDVVADVTDRFTLRGVDYPCTVTGGDDVTVPGDGSVVLGYDCDLSSLPGDVWPEGYDGDNEVTVTWDQEEFFTPGDDVVFTNHVDAPEEQETPAHDTITLADRITAEGGVPADVDLGEAGDLTWADVWAADGHRVTLEVPVDLDTTLAADECTTYTNVVSVPGSAIAPAQAETEVCRPAIAKTVEAGFERTYEWLVDKSVDATRVEIAEGGSASFTYTVTVTPDGFTDGGASFDGVITVTNPSGSTELAAVVADQDDVAGWTCAVAAEDADVTVPPGGSVDVAYACDPETGAHPDGDNTATATFGGATVSVTEPVDFAEEVSTDETIEVTDPRAPGGVVGTFDRADGEQTATYTWATPGVPGECTTYDNTATITSTGQTSSASVDVCVEAPLEVSKTATGSFDRDHDWTLDKVAPEPEAAIPAGGTHRFPYRVTATPAGYVDSGFEAHGEITVFNPNAYAAGGISATVSDELSGITGARCTVTDPQVQLAPGTSATLDYACTLAPTAGDYVGDNVATATWTPAALHAPARTGDPATASVDSEPVTVSLAVDRVTDFTVEVVDDPQGAAGPDVLGTATWGAEPGTAVPGEPTVFEYDGPVREGVPGECTPYANTASIDQEVGQDLEASAGVELCVEVPAGLEVEATAALDRDHAWEIDKVVERRRVWAEGDRPAEVDYTVRVTPGAATDSGWQLGGVTTVTNDNAWTDLAVDLSLATDVGEGVVCEYDDGPQVTVAPLDSVAAPFTCTFGGTSYTDGTVTAGATWDGDRASTATGPAVWDVTSIDDVVTVHDDLADPEGEGEVLGTVEWAADGEPTEFTYTLPFDVAPGTCEDFTNTAQIVETAQTAEGTVTVCRLEQLEEQETDDQPDGGPTPSPGPAPDAPDVEVKGAEATLPDTGAPAGLAQLGALGLLTTLAGLVLLWHSRRLRRGEGS